MSPVLPEKKKNSLGLLPEELDELNQEDKPKESSASGLQKNELDEISSIGNQLKPEEQNDIQAAVQEAQDEVDKAVNEVSAQTSTNPSELKSLKEKGIDLTDDKERIIWDQETEQPFSKKVGKFFGGILPAVGSTIKRAAIGAKELGQKSADALIAPLILDDDPENIKYLKEKDEEAGKAWRSFGSGAVDAFEGTIAAGAKAANYGTAATDALKELVGLQSKDESFEKHLARERFNEALEEDKAQNPDRLATALSRQAENLGEAGVAPEFSKNLSAEFKERALPEVDENVSSLANVLAPVGPEALLIKPVAAVTKPVIEGTGKAALKGVTKVGGNVIEGTGKAITGTRKALEKGAKVVSERVTGDPDFFLRSALTGSFNLGAKVPGEILEGSGRFLKDIGRQIDDVGVTAREGLFERAGKDINSGSVVKNLFGPGTKKPFSAEDVAKMSEDEILSATQKRTGQGLFRARAADKLSRLMGYYGSNGINGAVVGTVLGLPDIENAEDAANVVGSGVAIGLISASDPQNFHQAKIAERRADEDSDISRMRRDAAPETLARLDSLTDPKAYLVQMKQRVDNLDKAWSDLQTQPDSSEKKAAQARIDQVKERIVNSMKIAAQAKPQDIQEAQRLANLEFTDVLNLAKTTGQAAGIGNNMEVRLLNSDEIGAQVDKIFGNDKQQAEAVISNLEAKQNLTESEQASLKKAQETLNTISEYRKNWPDQRGFSVMPGISPEVNNPTIIINSDHIADQRGANFARILRHEALHGLMQFKEVQDLVRPVAEQYFDQKVRNDDGTETMISEGLYSDADLDKIAKTYAKKLDPTHDGQLWLSQFSSPEQIRNAIKEEIIAENFASTSDQQGTLRTVLDSKSQALADWYHSSNLNKAIGATRDALSKLGIKTDNQGKLSDIDVPLTQQSLSLMRKLQRQLRDYNESLTLNGDKSVLEETNIPMTKILANRALQERYKDADFWAKEFVVQAKDSSGNPVKEIVLSPKDAEQFNTGEWSIDNGRVVNEDGSPVNLPAEAVKGLPSGTRIVANVRIARNPDGSPKILSKSVVDALARKRDAIIKDAIDNAPDMGEANRLRDTGNGSYRGTMTQAQVDRIKTIPDVILQPAMKRRIEKINDVLRRNDGSRFVMEYQPRLKGGKYRSLSPKVYDIVPIGFQFSKAGNFLVNSISVNRLNSKLDAWLKQKPARLDAWGRDKYDFWTDFSQYLDNHRNGVPGQTNLDSDSSLAKKKADIINDFLNLYNKDTAEANPDRSQLKTPRGGDSPDRTIMAGRLDGMLSLDESFAQKLPIDYGKVVTNFLPQTSEQGFYSQLQNVIEQKMPNKASAAQIRGIIDPSKGSGIKAEEIKWSGFDDWLKDNPNPTKEDVINYLKNEGGVKFLEDEFAEDEGTQYSQYVLPGGTNYREIIMSLDPVREQPEQDVYNNVYNRFARVRWGKFYNELTPEQQQETQTELYNALHPIDNSKNYYSSHFPNLPNYVAHYRTNDRVDSEGKPGLFIEELQSDRHQQARDRGYQGDDAYEVLNASGDTIESNLSEKDALTFASEREGRTIRKGTSTIGVQDAPFRKDWPIQIFKRALRDAVESGKDWLGWTTGDTQARRYDLSKQVDSVRAIKNEDGTFKIMVSSPGAKDYEVLSESAEPDGLADIIGKDMARKISDQTEEIEDYTGSQLQIGGDGMKAFYDRILPNEIGKYIKKWGGKVESYDLKTEDKESSESENIKIHRVNITPEMKKIVNQQGQAQFLPQGRFANIPSPSQNIPLPLMRKQYAFHPQEEEENQRAGVR